MGMKYSKEFKHSIIAKLFPPSDANGLDVAKVIGTLTMIQPESRRLLNRWFSLGLLALLFGVFLIFSVVHLNKPVSFDGGMNLQVAQSLSEGRGYTREYQGLRPFPYEVQTNTPYLVPAAAVFKLFGVGLWQSQVVGLVYTFSLLLLIVAIVGRYCGIRFGLLCALSTLILPGVYDYSMDGYGEIAALFWWLWGTYVLFGTNDLFPPSGRRVFLSGVLLGLAVATKTVLIIGLMGTLAIYGLWLIMRRQWSNDTLRVLIILGGIFFPLLIVEVWRLAALGGIDSYQEWWSLQYGSIAKQAGISTGFNDTEGVIYKLLNHGELLSKQLRIPVWLMSVWLIMPIVLSPLCWLKGAIRKPWLRVWAASLLVVVLYLLWWLLITPTEKAWLRRIVDGLILLQLCWAFMLGWGWQYFSDGSRRLAVPLLLGTILIAGSVLALFSLTFIEKVRFNISQTQTYFYQACKLLNGLPTDAALFGQGWYGAPTLALYSQRSVENIDRVSTYELEQIGTGYLLFDAPAQSVGAFSRIIQRYPVEPLLPENKSFQIYRADFTTVLDPFLGQKIKSEKVLSYIDFTEQNYGLVYGMYSPGSMGLRWVSTDAEILLRYQENSDKLEVRVYHPMAPYVNPKEINIRVHFDGCQIGTLAFNKHTVLSYEIPEECLPKPGKVVRVRMQSDNMVDAKKDSRQLAFIVHAIGFVKP